MKRGPVKEEYKAWIAQNVTTDGYGKCQAITRAMVEAFPELRRIYGTYYCASWGAREHFWCIDADNLVVDPTAQQFPTKGVGIYSMQRYYGLVEEEKSSSAEIQEPEVGKSAQYYCWGNCDVMALALHRLTGLPLGLWGNRVPDEDFTEFAHAVVILDPTIPRWMDVNGIHEGQPDLVFSEKVGQVSLQPATERDVRDAFTTEDIPAASIREAMQFARKHPATAEALSTMRSKEPADTEKPF